MTKSNGLFDSVKQKLMSQLLEIENNPKFNDDEKVSKIINTTAVICAAVAIQPIPFADIFILTPIQGFMGYKIGQIRGVDLKEESMGDIIKYIMGVVGLGIGAQQTAIGLFKLGLPGLGGLMTIPLVAGLTYGIGRAMDIYFKAVKQGRKPSDDELKNAFKRGKSEAGSVSSKEVKSIKVD
jgi:uncharacterized protein (DUF697 family)